MIEMMSDCEYITLIADLIKLLMGLDKFTLKIWVANRDIAFEFNSDDDFLFLNEGMRVYRELKYKHIGGVKKHNYIFYDNIVNIQVVQDEEK